MTPNSHLQAILLRLVQVLLVALLAALFFYSPAHTLPEPGLRNMVRPGLRMAVSVHTPWLEDEAYTERVLHDFNTVLPENTFKYQWIHPCPPAWLLDENPSVAAWVEQVSGTEEDPGAVQDCRENPAEWNWEPMDGTVRWANAHNMGLFALPLVWHMQNPGWLTHPSVDLAPNTLDRLMQEHIEGVIAHYCEVDRGSIYAYNVVNEAITPQGTLYPGGPWPAIGDDYVHRAFSYASVALADHCPERPIKLFYNDHDFEFGPFTYDEGGRPTSWAAGVLELLRPLQQGPRPLVNGVGMQAHLALYQYVTADGEYAYSNGWNPTAMQEVMDTFSRELDVEIHITELDVALKRWRDDCPADAPRPLFSGGDCPITDPEPSELFNLQARWFEATLRACLQAERCTGFGIWGLSDNRSWLRAFQPVLFEVCPERGLNRFLADKMIYCPKPAYWALYDVLRLESPDAPR